MKQFGTRQELGLTKSDSFLPTRSGRAHQQRGQRIKIFGVRRLRSILVSKNSGHFEQLRLPEAKCRELNGGSLFLLLTLLLTQQKRELLPKNHVRLIKLWTQNDLAHKLSVPLTELRSNLLVAKVKSEPDKSLSSS